MTAPAGFDPNCRECDAGGHDCPGCGVTIPHGQGDCGQHDHVDLDQDPVIAAWLKACRDWDAQIADLKEKRDRAVELIQQRMGDASEARIGGKPVVTWRYSKPGTYIDRKALEADLPDVAARYTREKAASRPFKILEVESS